MSGVARWEDTPAGILQRRAGRLPQRDPLESAFEATWPMREAAHRAYYEARGWLQDGYVRRQTTMPDGQGSLVSVNLDEARRNQEARNHMEHEYVLDVNKVDLTADEKAAAIEQGQTNKLLASLRTQQIADDAAARSLTYGPPGLQPGEVERWRESAEGAVSGPSRGVPRGLRQRRCVRAGHGCQNLHRRPARVPGAKSRRGGRDRWRPERRGRARSNIARHNDEPRVCPRWLGRGERPAAKRRRGQPRPFWRRRDRRPHQRRVRGSRLTGGAFPMQDLTGEYHAALVPSSMSAGGEVHHDPGNLQMTAPGSQPVSAPAAQWPGQAPETLPLPVDSNGAGEDYARLVDADGGRTTRPQQTEVDPAGNAGRWRPV